MEIKEQVLQAITEQIEKNMGKENGVAYTTISSYELADKMGLDKDEVKNAYSELLKESKLFFHKEDDYKINYDGTKRENDTFRFFTDKTKKNHYASKKEIMEKEKEIKVKALKEVNKEKVRDLSDSAKAIYKAFNENLTDGRAYINSKAMLQYSKLDFDEFKKGMEELKSNKVLYNTKISKKLENGKDWVEYAVVENTFDLKKVIDRENYKKGLDEKNNKEKSKEKESMER